MSESVSLQRLSHPPRDDLTGGTVVLLALGFLWIVAEEPTGVMAIVRVSSVLLCWAAATVAVDVLSALRDERDYFRFDGWLPLVFRMVLPLVFYAAFLLEGADDRFRQLLAATAWAATPLLVPAVLTAVGVTGWPVVVVWLAAFGWTAVLWTRALATTRVVSARFAVGVVATVGLVVGWLVAPDSWRAVVVPLVVSEPFYLRLTQL